MPQDKEPTSETAGKEFAISVLLKEIHSTNLHVDVTASNNVDSGDKSAPDRFVWLDKNEGDNSMLIQETGELEDAEKVVNDSWKARLTGSGRVSEFWVGGQPVKVIDGSTEVAVANQKDLQRELVNARVLEALQWLRKFTIVGA